MSTLVIAWTMESPSRGGFVGEKSLMSEQSAGAGLEPVADLYLMMEGSAGPHLSGSPVISYAGLPDISTRLQKDAAGLGRIWSATHHLL